MIKLDIDLFRRTLKGTNGNWVERKDGGYKREHTQHTKYTCTKALKQHGYPTIQ